MPKPSTNHKIAITVCIACSIGLAVYVYYHFASVIEEQKLNGINKYVDNFLRWSALIGMSIAVLTFILTWWDSVSSRSILIFLTSVVIADLVFAILAYFLMKPLIIKSYKKMFLEDGYVAVAASFETSNECCGWSDASVTPVTPDCAYLTKCDVIVGNLMKGKNFWIFIISLSISTALVVYCLIAHILLISTSVSAYQALSSSK